MTDDSGPVRSQQEIAAAIRSLTPAQWARLERVGTKYAWRAGWLADDLVNEALARAVAGERHCPANVDLVRFLAEAMRSIADDEANKLPNQVMHVSIRRGAGEDDTGVEPPDLALNAEQSLITEAVAIREGIMVHFEDDRLATEIVDGLLAGYSAAEIGELLEVDLTTYNSKRRKIRRTLDKAFPQRRQP